MKAKVAERGQVTIPQALRKKLGIRQGVILDFKIHNGKLIATKAETDDPVSLVFGCLKKPFHTDHLITELRGSRDHTD
ncbi:MAG: AbrB/MazE/SpoVT family DNA-binding domain-containing protein [Gammaproteobacteria bacterium]|nr:AbrB/MazE/SpoVT family DNA-binding domain-containing protein [Gammaproteobacteria bacterium]